MVMQANTQQQPLFDLSLGLEGSCAIVTGATGQIGQVIVDALLAAGCHVGGIDIKLPVDLRSHKRLHWYQTDVTDESRMRNVWLDFRDRYGGPPSICICAAGLDLSFIEHHESVMTMPVEQFRRTMDVNTTGTFIASKLWLKFLAAHLKLEPSFETSIRNVSLIVIGSEAGVLGVPGNADYASSKSAIQYGLVKSLAPDAVRVFRRAMVNAIAPGAVDTPQFRKECDQDSKALWTDAQATVAAKKPISIEHIARTCIFLASEKWSGGITGQVIRVDGGKSGRMFWNQGGGATW